MTLKNYRLAEPSKVILADDRDPHVSWQHHLERAGRGGVDIVAIPGTPVYARTPGVMRRIPNNGGAGNSCRFEHDDNPGWADVFSHLTGYVGVDGQHFEAGQVVAYTGTTGGVAPHLHWHLLDPQGKRQNPWNHFTPLAVSRPTSATTLEEDDVSFAERIPSADGTDQAAALVIKEIQTNLRRLNDGINEVPWEGGKQPLSVVLPDLLRAVYNLGDEVKKLNDNLGK